MKKKIKYLLLIILTFFTIKTNVNAGSLSIWASKSSVTVGSSVTISVKASNLAGTFDIISSNGAVLSGGANGSWLENDTYTFKFTAKSAGKATITVNAADVADFDTDAAFSGSKSITLNVVNKSSSSSGGTTADKKEYSNNNNLKSLEIEGYSILPEFNKDVTEYKLTVDQNVEKINIIANKEHDKASISGAGEVNLSLGENTIEINVTAENGNEKKYKIIVSVEDLNPIKVKIDKNEYTVVRKNNDLIEKLEHYEETSIKLDNQDIVAYTNKLTKTTLVLLKDKENKVDYYIYDTKEKTYEKYKYIKVNNIVLQLLDTESLLSNYKKYETTINEQNINIYKLNKKNKIGLIYGINVVTGNKGFYQYDEEEMTISKYYNDEVKFYKDEAKKYQKYLVITIAAFSLTVIIASVVSIIKSKKRRTMKKI